MGPYLVVCPFPRGLRPAGLTPRLLLATLDHRHGGGFAIDRRDADLLSLAGSLGILGACAFDLPIALGSDHFSDLARRLSMVAPYA